MTRSSDLVMVERELDQPSIATKQATDETAASVLSEPPEAWADCETCGGEGAINRTIHVYENGCGFSHPDVEIIPCTDCMGTGGAIVDAASTYCDICGGDCSSANPPVFNCPLTKPESSGPDRSESETALRNRVIALTAALRRHDDYMSEQFSGPTSDALHPNAAINWQHIRNVLSESGLSKTSSCDHDGCNLRGFAEPNHQPHAVSQGWRDIETAPKDGTKVLAYWFGNDMPFISVIWWRGDKYPDSSFPWRNTSNDGAIGGFGQCHLPKQQQTWRQGPTHWMPLPAPPSPAKTGGVE